MLRLAEYEIGRDDAASRLGENDAESRLGANIAGEPTNSPVDLQLQRRVLSDGREYLLPFRYFDVQCLVPTFLAEPDRASGRGVRVNVICPGYTLTPMNLRPEVAEQSKIEGEAGDRATAEMTHRRQRRRTILSSGMAATGSAKRLAWPTRDTRSRSPRVRFLNAA
jgi:hypothetical protein